MLTKERAELLTNYLTEDEERGQRLITLTADEAVAEISKDGFDFTVDELHAYGEVIVALNKHESGELSEEQLEDVAGGFLMPFGDFSGLQTWLFRKTYNWMWKKLKW